MAKKRTQKRTPAITAPKRRKGFLSVALPWLKRFGAAAGIVILVLWLGAWLVVTGTLTRAKNWTENQLILASADAGFQIKNLLVEGRDHTDASLMLALLNIQINDPLFGVSPQNAQDLLEETSWIRHAHIQRRLPDTLYIKLTEKIPTARLAQKGTISVLDELGKPITAADPQDFTHLILLSGKDADSAMPNLIAALNALPDQKTILPINKAVREGQRRWDLTLTNGITLKMPEDDQLPMALARIVLTQQAEQILDLPDLNSIDLRFNDKLIINAKPGKALQSGKTSRSL